LERAADGRGGHEGNAATDSDAAPTCSCLQAPRAAPPDGTSGTGAERVEAVAFPRRTPALPRATAVAAPPHTPGASAAAALRVGGGGSSEDGAHARPCRRRRRQPTAGV